MNSPNSIRQGGQTDSSIASSISGALTSFVRAASAPRRDRVVVAWSIGLIVLGILTSLAGIAVITHRMWVAHTFLEANIMFGMPMSSVDVAKIQLVMILGVVLAAVGGFVFAVSLVLGLVQLTKEG